MDVETCPRCGKPLATEVGTSFLCCLDCKRRLIGYTTWSVGVTSGPLAVHRTRGEADSSGNRVGTVQVHSVWTDLD